MKIFYHSCFESRYALDPAAERGRLEPSVALLKEKHLFVQPRPATKEEILQVHSERHYKDIASDKTLLQTALFSAGAAIEASETAMEEGHAFALCRPPGHHASADSCWGFCYFNNIAVAVRRLLDSGSVGSALIVDFDLHYGDGTANIFASEKNVLFWHGEQRSRQRYLESLTLDLAGCKADIVAVSAGFDRGVNDWGNMLTREDYHKIGQLLADFAEAKCSGRLFAALEGGYNARALAGNIDAFIEGLGD